MGIIQDIFINTFNKELTKILHFGLKHYAK